jgi:transposase
LDAKPHPGPATRLNRQQPRQLEGMLLQGAKAQGWPNELWTTRRIAELIRRTFGVSLHHDHVGRFLHRVLHWSPQKPSKRARERDEAAIQRWQRDAFPRIVEAAAARGAHLVFLDESGFFLTPNRTKTASSAMSAHGGIEEKRSEWVGLTIRSDQPDSFFLRALFA